MFPVITSASLDRHTQRSAAEIPTQMFTWQLPSPAFPAQGCTLRLCITPRRNTEVVKASGPRSPEEFGLKQAGNVLGCEGRLAASLKHKMEEVLGLTSGCELQNRQAGLPTPGELWVASEGSLVSRRGQSVALLWGHQLRPAACCTRLPG